MSDLSDGQVQRIGDINDSSALIELIKVHWSRICRGGSGNGDARSSKGQLSNDTVLASTERLSEGRKIRAIKVCRDVTNTGLIDAKQFVESFMARLWEADPE